MVKQYRVGGWSLLKMRGKGKVAGHQSQLSRLEDLLEDQEQLGVLDKKVEQMWKMDSSYESNSLS